MSQSTGLPVVFMPGGVTPVRPSCAPLLEELGEEVEPLLKDLEVYASDEPPAAYSMQLEVDGLERVVTAAGLDTFHLVGYSGGGAVCLDFCVQHPERLRSLAIFEPANVPGPWGLGERASWDESSGWDEPDELRRQLSQRWRDR
jgi:pimeloyl-ACP methyl ester carboxylesterase